MKKAIATTALAAALALSLSGCTFGLLKPPAPNDPQPAPTQSETETDSGTTPTDDSSDPATYTDGSTVHCEDGESLEITNDNYSISSLYVSGNCVSALVSASNVTITFESLSSLSVAGLYNTITVGSDIAELSITGDMNSVLGAGAASISVDGYANAASFDSADSVWVGGEENTVNWYAGAASGTDAGTSNVLTAP